MKKQSRLMKLLTIGITGAFLLTGCGGGGGAYSDYASSYNRVSAQGGIDANLTATLTMDGQTNEYSGNFKVDTANNLLYYEMGSDGEKTVQFSDGTYLYTEQNGVRSKYALDGAKKEPQRSDKTGTDSTPPTFDTSGFLQDFSSFLDAGNVKEMGLLDPVAEAAVTKVTKEGDVYTLEISDSIVESFLNSMARNHNGEGDSVQVSDLKNFTYQATVKDGFVTSVTYGGTMKVSVPETLMSSGSAADFDLDFGITVDYNNPGEAVTITLPSTDGYTEV